MVAASTQAPGDTVTARSPRQSSTFWTRLPSRSRRMRAAGLAGPAGGEGGGGAISVALAMMPLVGGVLGEDPEGHHAPGRQALLGPLAVVRGPGRPAGAPVDGALAGGAHAMGTLRGL